MEVVIRICPVCGETFKIKQSKRPKTYCSPKCQKEHNTRAKDKSCPTCGKPMLWKSKICIACYHKQISNQRGDKAVGWKRGYYFARGYKHILRAEHPFANSGGYVREHRLVIEKAIGGYLKPHEIVHHLNGIRDDNRFVNLAVVSRRNHSTNTIKKSLQGRIRELEAELSQQKLV